MAGLVKSQKTRNLEELALKSPESLSDYVHPVFIALILRRPPLANINLEDCVSILGEQTTRLPA